MILSHKNKFIFFKPLKSAGSSVELALTAYCGLDDVLTGSPYQTEKELGYCSRNNRLGYREVWHQHTPPSEFFSGGNDPSMFYDYTKATVIRNPYDLVVSYFWWSFYAPDSHMKNHTLRPDPMDNTRVLKTKFQSYVESSAHFDKSGNQQNVLEWLSSRVNMFYSHHIDVFIRYEFLRIDFSKFCGQIGLDPIALRNLKGEVRRSPLHYSDYYNDNSHEIVSENFKHILKDFEYNFNDA
jgi:hypothetical protein